MEPVPVSWGLKKILIVFFLAVITLFVWTWVSSPLVVSVTGMGEVSVPAESATVSFTLSANEASPQVAVANVKSRAEMVRTLLKSKGILEEDIAESQVTAVPAGLLTTGASGYQATISMAAKTRRVTEVSTLISDLYNNGVAVVSQPVLSVENQDELEQQALDSAMRDAARQAGEIASKNGKLIKKAVSVSQVSSPTTSTSTTRSDILTESGSQIAAQNGVFKIIKAVSISYKMW